MVELVTAWRIWYNLEFSAAPVFVTQGKRFGISGVISTNDSFFASVPRAYFGSEINEGTGILRYVVSVHPEMAHGPAQVMAVTSNVSSQVSVTQNGFGRNRATGIWAATMTVTTTGSTTILGRLFIVLTNLTSTVTMTNSLGISAGRPYVASLADLAPGASASISIQFTNPSNGLINCTPVTYSEVVP